MRYTDADYSWQETDKAMKRSVFNESEQEMEV